MRGRIVRPVALALFVLLAPLAVRAEESAIWTADATWCAPTPTHCRDWGDGAMLAALNSFRHGDRPYWVRVARGDRHVDVLVVSHCGCPTGGIDLSPAAFRQLAPLSRGRIAVTIQYPAPGSLPETDEPQPTLPATDTAG